MEPWNHGTEELWNLGTVELWNCGTVEQWNGGTVERWNSGTVEQWNSGFHSSTVLLNLYPKSAGTIYTIYYSTCTLYILF